MSAPVQAGEPVAIVGSACRFAGSANSPSKLWELLREPRDLGREVPASRFSAEGFYHRDGAYHGHSNVTQAYLLDEDDADGNGDPSAFDAEFFGIKPAEAKTMDPQQRVLLEVVYEATEAAGLPLARLKGSDTAVYVGSMTDDYAAMMNRDLQDTPTYAATGTARSMLSNRVSYVFDWHGPSVSLDTACSASLVAVHMAVQTLRAGESRTALACGTNLILGPENFIAESKLNMLSPDGRGRMWDQGANGYARGDGVTAIVLKTLRAALEDGDHVECVIRETAVNQDGATAGITMPSATAQEALIRKTYAKAGLDLAVRSDRPQYFEAHGTGTPAGDPIEAEAIYKALGSRPLDSGEDPLYVGSIKTVVGHTEGAAGIAAILKASLALQHACIPPNLLFERISDQVALFYKNVQIPVARIPWPSAGALAGEPRRASVNSFGFGGANAHAILESYNAVKEQEQEQDTTAATDPTLFVFSASSQQSLAATLRAYLAFLDDGDREEDINLRDLAWTLRQRRSTLSWRVSIVASSLDELRTKLRSVLRDDTASVGVKALPAARSRILGIFTGQGAQYVRMAAELIQQSATARDIIRRLEAHLAELPDGDGPTWSLEAELLADASSSRVREGSVSQPLCIAVQILLVDFLRLAGVRFDAVVGHSSGEIAAAYSAGFLTARDAMCIAYYRGLYLQQASSPRGSQVKGAMLAVGTSPKDAAELCEDSAFKGRIVVAAINSPSSVTISGDEDAIEELEMTLEDERKFFRRLEVDKAYHSPHMLPCYDAYVASLRRCGIALQTPGPDSATWFSSVFDGLTGAQVTGLGDTYWAANLTKPVLFSQAVSCALAAQPCHLVLEVGPHPSLKRPACQVIEQVLGNKDFSYRGTLARETNAAEATSSVLGFLWTQLDSSRIDLALYGQMMYTGSRRSNMLKDLPTYRWNHDVKHWHESRRSRKLRTRQRRVHPLLGDISPDSAAHNMCWVHVLSVSEMEWLSGHQVQGQVVFPAAGYVCTAIEAARFVAEAAHPGKNIRLIEIRDATIHQAVAFDDTARGLDTLISMADITWRTPDRASAKFTYSVALSPQHGQHLTLAASCHVEIILGDADPSALPARKPALPHMLDVDSDRFYAALADLGYEFSARFRSLSHTYRKHCRATCLVDMGPCAEGDEDEVLLIHPAELDATLQSVTLAHSYPYDEELRTMHLPTAIRHIRINPALCSEARRQQNHLAAIDTIVAERDARQRGIMGHANLYSQSSAHAAVQVHGATFKPVAATSAEDDRRLFSEPKWIRSRPDGAEAARHIALTQKDHDMAVLMERIAVFYLRKFDREVAPDHPARTTFPHNWYLKLVRHVSSLAENGGDLSRIPAAWLGDTLQDILQASAPFSHLLSIQVLNLVGTQMPRVFDGETTILEQFRNNDFLDRIYTDGFGPKEAAVWVGQAVKQIVDRYPHTNILEIGAGTGGGTKAIFREIGQNFSSFTYTDISSAFFERAASTFSQHKERMVFKTLDMERDPIAQGFAEDTYDIIVAFLVLHATSDVASSLSHIRKLLKPGGFLVVAEGYDPWEGTAYESFTWGPFPGWWLRADAGQTLSPHLSPGEWDGVLRSTGFSGVDTSMPMALQEVFKKFCFVSQATDDYVDLLRQPLLASAPHQNQIQKLVLVGGETPRTLQLVEGLQRIFAADHLADAVYHFKTLRDVDYDVVDVHSTVISLTELDTPVFKDIEPETFMSLRSMFGSGKTLLWVTSGRLDAEPFSNMTAGFGNVAVNETPDLRLQQLDIGDPATTEPETIAEVLLRLHHTARKADSLVWTVEPEIVLNSEGRELLPRMRYVPELNDQYNSARRLVVRETQLEKLPSSTMLRLEPGSGGGFTAWEVPRRDDNGDIAAPETEPYIELRTVYSTLSAIQTSLGYKFLVFGLDPETETKHLALVPSLDSTVRLSTKSVVPYPQNVEVSDGQALSVISAHLAAIHILRPLFSSQTLVAHSPPSTIARALATQAAAKGVRLVFTTDSTSLDVPESWIRLPRYLTQSDAEEILSPINPSSFVGFVADEDTEKAENQTALMECLRGRCQFLTTAATIYSSTGFDSEPCSAFVLGDVLNQALESAGPDLLVEKAHPTQASDTPFRLGDIVCGSERPESPLSVIDWTAAAAESLPLPVHASRLDSDGIFRSENRSYWMVGMTGALGLALADWMIRKGVRTLVMTSRKPNIDPEWVAAHRKKGANVVILPCDITDEAALQAVYSQIRATLPPVAGVINGAMVLSDTTIRNMTFDQLMTVVRPKVDGSIHLDKIFERTNLDFFVMISSISRVCGNHGQANYAAANAFLCGLAGQRRKRGLRAATVDIGAIIGAGYFERERHRGLDAVVERHSMMRMSEEDWCQSICAAIVACRPEAPYGPNLTTGFSEVPLHMPKPPSWHANPIFSTFVAVRGPTGEKAETKTTVEIGDQLRACRTMEDVRQVVERAFAAQIRTVLQVTTSDEDLMASRSSELGLDSLVSVDIGQWFLKRFGVKVPILRIMGHEPLASIAQYAVENMPTELAPGLSVDGSSDSADEERATRQNSETATLPSTVPREGNASTRATSPGTLDFADGRERDSASSDDGTFDWETDMADILPTISDPGRACDPPCVVVLTGCTGLLGRHLVSHLLAQPTVQKIICLAVRSLASRRQQSKLPGSGDPRMSFHAGSLEQPLLGLSREEAGVIFSEADVVIHNGVDTGHLKHYADVRATNVGSTTTLARLCLPRRIPLHYVSSVGLGLWHENSRAEGFPPGPIKPGPAGGPDYSFGYARSKWTCERLLERVSEAYGLRVCIHRPSTIVREGEDALGTQAETDWINSFLTYVRRLKAVPRAERNKGSLDLVCVDTVCEGIMTQTFHPTRGCQTGEGGVTYVHEVGDKHLPLGELQYAAREEPDGPPFEVLPREEWTARAMAAGLRPGVAALIEGVDEEREDYPKFLRGTSSDPSVGVGGC